MIDPLTSLSFAVQSSPGVYALLLGSGVSQSAQIPTGWGVTMDLVRKLAAAEDAGEGADPEAWYRETFGGEPDYSKLLDTLAKTPAERQRTLRGYFEPSPEEDEEGKKQPTPAHRAVARLVKGGFVRVILTTNFDRLIERALEDEGIQPAVVSTPDAVEGMEPLVHQHCLVVKIHGDYLDARIKNTAEELDDYDARTEQLLERVLDEFGLIVCGWSGEWDTALCRAIESSPARRYTFYWTTFGKLTEFASRLIRHRAGVVVPIEGADQFFSALADRVEAIAEAGHEHPMTVRAAEAAAKRYVARTDDRIRLHDLIHEATEQAVAKLERRYATTEPQANQTEAAKALVEGTLSDLSIYLACGMPVTRWGDVATDHLIVRSLERLGEKAVDRAGYRGNDAMKVIPAVQALYVLGLAATAEDNVRTLVRLLADPKVTTSRFGAVGPLLREIRYDDPSGHFQQAQAPDEYRVPMSEWLFRHCRPLLQKAIPADRRYERVFDRFEAVQAVVEVDLRYGSESSPDADSSGRNYFPRPGRFLWKLGSFRSDEVDPFELLLEDRSYMAALASAGVCGGDETRLELTVRRVRKAVQDRFDRSL
ncbi:SIR2 family protein [Alienimonas chondri]|uniref:SIR2-like domain-containing protein n=1 Tax=Alienimonas chondri TaxID=2681879 RepID=A0ABX1VAB7_9PLAN|nr:SIR2 family protein [Alienimonas chondri]NNJ24323.1 hypothetical protein [Alienimonas chondri]